ncbi:dynamin family protein [Pelagibaculum spongiae]|uniref:Dynamin N-terminal domain-containing protein n=1 Tax=Pelagibaculum spongiae TaxID=2080658 RepID=A0A2V1H0K5_9GAMM|nr:dynamin family protein [Pelagibaculum spongiae]PVZ72179.1 hypothetical protein DC094_03960 [Pelagibaculum spongiae]
METAAFDKHFQACSQWRKQLLSKAYEYRQWLTNNRLLTDSAEEELDLLESQLSGDQLTLAFIGEFSRGKSELINALFFAEFGCRVLPSQPGRTTMCPTELMFDHDTRLSWIRLLPIETRLQQLSLMELREKPECWRQLPLSSTDPEAIKSTLSKVTETRLVSITDAEALGFDPAMLENSNEQPGMVSIPAWRHAMVSFPHPLLQQGLRVLDTPGLNAVGSEPELTLSLLPSADAVVFVLAADAGVSASDLSIWKERVMRMRFNGNGNLIAVLNKADTISDDMDPSNDPATMLNKLRQITASQLALTTDQVLPISAKQGLLGKARHDYRMLENSNLPRLEKLLADLLISQRGEPMVRQSAQKLQLMIAQSNNHLELRHSQVLQQQQQLSQLSNSNRENVDRLVIMTRNRQTTYQRQLQSLRASQRLIEMQARQLRSIVSDQQVNQMVERTRINLDSSWTTPGLSAAMRQFFHDLDNHLARLNHQIKLAARLQESVFHRFDEQFKVPVPAPKALQLELQMNSLTHIRNETEQFSTSLKMTLSIQNQVSRFFFNTSVNQVLQQTRMMQRQIQQWGHRSLQPLLEHCHQQKHLMQQHLKSLNKLGRSGQDARRRQQALRALADKINQQKKLLQQIEVSLDQPAYTPKLTTTGQPLVLVSDKRAI